MNAQAIITIDASNEVTSDLDQQKELVTLTPEMLGIIGGGEGMICIG
jgi:hypothetical protein